LINNVNSIKIKKRQEIVKLIPKPTPTPRC
jgi:hypothetical protein